MKTILKHIQDLNRKDWDYYFGIDRDVNIKNPFLDDSITHQQFIYRYFERGEKSQVLDSINLDFNQLRYPNHVNSVFFLGLILYNNTYFKKEFGLNKNKPGYKTFPFIWFLTSLYHDNAYHIEKDKTKVAENGSLENLYKNYSIDNYLLNEFLDSTSKILFDSCKGYYDYRVKESEVIDHGLFGGILLFDRLIKIRREKEVNQLPDSLFWGETLEEQYKLAAFAIAMHNI